MRAFDTDIITKDMFTYLVLIQWTVTIISDYAIGWLSGQKVLSVHVDIAKILIDNGTHSLTALICWTSVLVQLTQKNEHFCEICPRY